MTELTRQPVLQMTPSTAEGGATTYRINSINDLQGFSRNSFEQTLLQVLAKLNENLEKNNEALGEALGVDQGIVVNLMKQASSAARKNFGTVETIQDAVRKLGRDAVRFLVLHQLAYRLGSGARARADRLITHSLVVAEIAKDLGKLRNVEFGRKAYLAGLTHDYGKLLILSSNEKAVREIAAACHRDHLPTIEGERQILASPLFEAVDHAGIGAQFLSLAGNPREVVEAVRSHHDPERIRIDDWNSWNLAGVIHLADYFARRSGYGDGIEPELLSDLTDPVPLLRLGQELQAMEELVGQAIERARLVIGSLRTLSRDSEPNELMRRRAALRSAFRAQLKESRHLASSPRVSACYLILDTVMEGSIVPYDALIRACRGKNLSVQRVLNDLLRYGLLAVEENPAGTCYRLGDRLERMTPTEVVELIDTGDSANIETAPITGRRSVACESGVVRKACWSPRGERIAVLLGNGSLQILDGNTLQTESLYPPANTEPTEIITDIDWTADGSGLLVALEGGVSRLFDERLSRIREGYSNDESNLSAVACHPHDRRVAAFGMACGEVTLSRFGSGPKLEKRVLGSQASAICSLAWSSDGRHLAAGSANGVVRIWDATECDVAAVHAGHTGAVESLTWTPDGRYLLSGGADGSVRSWSLVDDRYEWANRRHSAAVGAVSIATKGDHVVSMSRIGEVLVSGRNGRRIVARMGCSVGNHPGGRRSVFAAFHPDRERLLLPGPNGLGLQVLEGTKWSENEEIDSLKRLAEDTLAQIDLLNDRQWNRPETVRLLHLSDLHLSPNQDAVEIADALYNDVIAEMPRQLFDAVVISGDLVNRASIAEYRTCFDFLARLRDKLNIPPRHFVIVPGNHDVNWNATPCRLPKAQVDDARKNAYCPHRKACHRANLEADDYELRFENFAKYLHARFLRREYPMNYGQQWSRLTLPHLGLRFLGYNTSWRIDGCHKEEANVHQSLQVKARSANSDDLETIAVWHHPLPDMGAAAQGFESHLRSLHTVVGLHGHIHEHGNATIGLQSLEPMLVLATGSLQARGKALREGTKNAYELIELNLKRRTLRIHSRSKLPGTNDWGPDQRWQVKGKNRSSATHEFNLPPRGLDNGFNTSTVGSPPRPPDRTRRDGPRS